MGLASAKRPFRCSSQFCIIFRFFARFVPARPQNANVNMTKLGKTYYAITDGPWANRINSETLDTEEYLDFVKLLGINASTAHPHFG